MDCCEFRTVLLIEDEALAREELSRRFASKIDNCMIQATSTLASALSLLETRSFDLIVIDPGLKRFGGGDRVERVNVVAAILAASPGAFHIVITGLDSSEEAERFRKMGVAAYFSKNVRIANDIARLVCSAREGGFVSSVAGDAPVSDSEFPELFHSKLTPRTVEIFNRVQKRPAGVSKHMVFGEIADDTGLAIDTIRSYYRDARSFFKMNHILTDKELY